VSAWLLAIAVVAIAGLVGWIVQGRKVSKALEERNTAAGTAAALERVAKERGELLERADAELARARTTIADLEKRHTDEVGKLRAALTKMEDALVKGRDPGAVGAYARRVLSGEADSADHPAAAAGS
jgi:uncharacterized protein HemX